MNKDLKFYDSECEQITSPDEISAAIQKKNIKQEILKRFYRERIETDYVQERLC